MADSSNYTIRKIEPDGTNWSVATIGGLAGAQPGSADGTGTAPRFYYPQGVTVDSSGNVYVCDTANNIIRQGVFAQYVSASVETFVPPATNGALQVMLMPAGIGGQWRLSWELNWHTNGEAVSNLAQGEYSVEFSTVPGYVTFNQYQNLAVTNGATTVITNEYYPSDPVTDTNNTGTLTVDIQPSPPSGAGWFFLGSPNAVFAPGFSTNLAGRRI